jgi:hypothetical protein
MLDPIQEECLWLGAVLALLSGSAIVARVRAGTLLSALGGIHVNVLLFFAISIFCYVDPASRDGLAASLGGRDRNHLRIVRGILVGGWPLAGGYAIAVVLDVWRQWRRDREHRHPQLERRQVHTSALAAIGLASAIGYAGSLFEFSRVGAGTVFPVLKLLLYPAVALSVFAARREKPVTLAVAAAIIGSSAYVAIFSPWRSELIFVSASLGIGMFMRNRRQIMLPAATLVFALLFLLPFVHEKKIHFEEVSKDPVGTFGQTLDLSLEERSNFLAGFWALRINAARELGFVVDGLANGSIRERGGLSYWEALQQLVPRVLWPSKPSFNLITNFDLAREIGLVGKSDKTTSWGVNVFAEAVWNFGSPLMLLFVPLFCLLAAGLDRLIPTVARDPTVAWTLSATLFFQFLGGPGLVQVATYVLWLFLAARLASRLLETRAPHQPLTAPRLNPV